MDVLCELYPVEMTAIFASKHIFAAAATGGARTAELPSRGHTCVMQQQQLDNQTIRLIIIIYYRPLYSCLVFMSMPQKILPVKQ